MNSLSRIQILCFIRFAMPNLLIGIVLVGYGLYGLATFTPMPENLPYTTPIDYRLRFGLGALLGAGFAFFGIRRGLASIRYDGEDSEDVPGDRL